MKKFALSVCLLVGLSLGGYLLNDLDQWKKFAWNSARHNEAIHLRVVEDEKQTRESLGDWFSKFKNSLESSKLENFQEIVNSVDLRMSNPEQGNETEDGGLQVTRFGLIVEVNSKQLFHFFNEDRKDIDFSVEFKEIYISKENRNSNLDPIGFDAFGEFKVLNRKANSLPNKIQYGKVRAKMKKVGQDFVPENLTFEVSYQIDRTRHPAFVEATQEFFPKDLKFSLRREAIRRGGYAIASGDYDSDGFIDFVIGDAEKTFLLHNNSGKSFEIDQSIMNSQKKIKAAAFLDLDNDGDLDLFGTKFIPDQHSNGLFLYQNEGGRFEEKSDFIVNKMKSNYPMPIAVGRFDSDSLLDIYVGYPGAQDFTFSKDELSSRNGHSQGLYQNLGSLQFADSTERAQFDGDRRDLVFPHSSIAFDIDKDFDSDLFVLDDRDNVSPIYRSNGQLNFTMINEKIGVTNKNYAMGAALGDLNNDGNPDLVVSYVNLHVADRFESLYEHTWSEKKNTGFAGTGLQIFINNGKGSFYQLPDKEIKGFLGEGAANVEIVDYDNDGKLDIYLTAGLWSGGNEDISTDFISQMLGSNTSSAWDLKDRSPSKSQSAWMEKLSQNPNYSFAGGQRNVLLKNMGNLEFMDVAALEGVDSIQDGYVLSVADINNDGFQDLFLRNGDAGSDLKDYKTLQIFLNNGINNNIRFKLVGKNISKDAIGTHISLVDLSDRIQVAQIVSNNGAAQSERVAHFGLGDKKSAKQVVVEWGPNSKQVFTNVESGEYLLVEGEELNCLSCITKRVSSK